MKLSRLGPEQQKDAASQLAAGEIKSMGEYHPAPAEPEEPPPPEPESPPAAPTVPSVPYSLGDKHYASIEESMADLKNPKVCQIIFQHSVIQKYHNRCSGYYLLKQKTFHL